MSLALESTLGWFISGPYSNDNETNVYNVDRHFLFVPPNLFNTNAVEKDRLKVIHKFGI